MVDPIAGRDSEAPVDAHWAGRGKSWLDGMAGKVSVIIVEVGRMRAWKCSEGLGGMQVPCFITSLVRGHEDTLIVPLRILLLFEG